MCCVQVMQISQISQIYNQPVRLGPLKISHRKHGYYRYFSACTAEGVLNTNSTNYTNIACTAKGENLQDLRNLHAK